MEPPLALGRRSTKRLNHCLPYLLKNGSRQPLLARFEKAWLNVSGKKGGFTDTDQERNAKERRCRHELNG